MVAAPGYCAGQSASGGAIYHRELDLMPYSEHFKIFLHDVAAAVKSLLSLLDDYVA